MPHEAVDDVLAQDHRRSSSAYTVYLLNPNPPGDRPYASSYCPFIAALARRAGGPARITGPLWVSSERRVWFDLTAGPSSYGPRRGGEGASLGDRQPRVRAAHADVPSALVPPFTVVCLAPARQTPWLRFPAMERAPTNRWDECRLASSFA